MTAQPQPQPQPALDALQALRERARAAAAAADRDAAAAVLAQCGVAVPPDADAAAPPQPRQCGVALLDIATTLTPIGDAEALLACYASAHRALAAAPDAEFDDFLVLWNNLAALHDQRGDSQRTNAVLNHIVQATREFQGTVGKRGADVLARLLPLFQRAELKEPLITLLDAVRRYRTSPGQADDDVASWLDIHRQLLLRVGCTAEASAVSELAADHARRSGDTRREVLLLNSRAMQALDRRDQAGAGEAFELLSQARQSVDASALAGTPIDAAVCHNLVTASLRLNDTAHRAQALAAAAHVLETRQRLGMTDSDEHAYALYQHALLLERDGEHAAAAPGYAAAAAIAATSASDRIEWLSLAARAWFNAGDFERASETYLRCLRGRVAMPTSAPVQPAN